jgi:hypothetical protein
MLILTVATLTIMPGSHYFMKGMWQIHTPKKEICILGGSYFLSQNRGWLAAVGGDKWSQLSHMQTQTIKFFETQPARYYAKPRRPVCQRICADG